MSAENLTPEQVVRLEVFKLLIQESAWEVEALIAEALRISTAITSGVDPQAG